MSVKNSNDMHLTHDKFDRTGHCCYNVGRHHIYSHKGIDIVGGRHTMMKHIVYNSIFFLIWYIYHATLPRFFRYAYSMLVTAQLTGCSCKNQTEDEKRKGSLNSDDQPWWWITEQIQMENIL